MNTLSANISLDLSPEALVQYQANGTVFLEAVERYRHDPEIRNTVDQSDVLEVFEFFGFDPPPDAVMKDKDMEVKVLLDQSDLIHFVISEDPNVQLTDQALGDTVVGGATAGSASSLSTVGSFACSTMASTMSSAASAGTAGSAS